MTLEPTMLRSHFDVAPLRAPRATPTYLLGLLVVAVVMLLLPLIYIAIILGVVGLVLLHVVFDVGLLSAGGWALPLLFYVTPIVVGGMLVLFMLKPIFLRRVEDEAKRVLVAQDEPALFELIGQVCRAVGAPFPARVQVNSMINASAGGHMGLVTGSGRNLTLTIGLPLVGGLTVKQFTGILAHEMGHFRQGVGLRLSQTIRRVNNWFFVVVYARDQWDRDLRAWADSKLAYVALIGNVSEYVVWLSRGVLKGLMRFGNIVSCFLMRQMEFQADTYEAALVGGTLFASTARRLRYLEASSQIVGMQLSQSWNERRLADDLPALVVANTEALAPTIRREVDEAIARSKTGAFDTHPSDLDRIRRVAEVRGVVPDGEDLPASSLFRDFPSLCRGVTFDHYTRVVQERVDKEHLVPTSEFLAKIKALSDKQESRERYLRGLVTALRPRALVAAEAMRGAGEDALGRLAEARRRLDALATPGRQAFLAHSRADRMMMQARQAEKLLQHGIRFDFRSFDLPCGGAPGIERALARAGDIERESLGAVEAAEGALRERLQAVRYFLSQPASGRFPAASRQAVRFDTLVEVLQAMGPVQEDVRELRLRHACIYALVRCTVGPEARPTLSAAIDAEARRLIEPLGRVRHTLDSARYPFDHAAGTVSMGHALLPQDLSARDPGGLFNATTAFLQGWVQLYFLIAGELAQIGEEVERAAGLDPDPLQASDGRERMSRAGGTPGRI